jgi:hypothetical protein
LVVVHRALGFRFVIYTLDHEPAHIHITGAGQAKINLLGPDGAPELIYSVGIRRSALRRLMAEVAERQDVFLRKWGRIMAGVTDRQLRAAEARGRKMLATEPRAAAAHYDRATGRVVVDLINGCTYAIPAHLVQDLHGASPDDLARVEVDGVGFNLHWPALDVDLYVPALVAGIFGTRTWMAQEQDRIAPRSATASESAAAPAGGTRDGRSRRIAHA